MRLWPGGDRLVLHRLTDRDTLILCYHAISASWPAALAITIEQLREQLEWLVGRGYRGVTFSDAVTQPQPQPGPTVAVTFDDAFSSVFEQAEPVLTSLALPGTVFAVTRFADSGRPLAWKGIDHWAGSDHDAELLGMSWSELVQLERSGWEIGSHTVTHPHLTELDDETLARELRESRAACEQALGRPVVSIAYPYGDVDARVVRAAAAAGYTTAAGLPPTLGPPTSLEWPRIGVYRPDSLSRFRLKASPLLRGVRTTLAPAESAARSSLLRHRPSP